MDKSNLELFKQAIIEGLSDKFDSVANSYTDEIVYSDRHKLAMRTIVYGKVDTKRAWSPKMKRIVAILIAAALLLTSCGIIFRNELREIFEDFFVKITYSNDESDVNTIEEIYELTYLPEGYTLKNEIITPLCTQYKFVDKNSNIIKFEQVLLEGSDFVVDSESGYSLINSIKEYTVYYRNTETYHYYICNDEKYSLKLQTEKALSDEEIVLILDGISAK